VTDLIVLRPYQEDALRQVLEYMVEHPTGRVLLVIPPRGGKTPTAGTLARILVEEQGAYGLWIASKIELIDQAVDHLVACGIPREKIGVIAANRHENPDATMQVASEATLDRRNKLRAEFVIWDEAQHDAAPRRRRIRGLYPDAFHLGITGTPERLGGGLDRDYDHMILAVQPSELIHDDYLAVPTIFAPVYTPSSTRTRRSSAWCYSRRVRSRSLISAQATTSLATARMLLQSGTTYRAEIALGFFEAMVSNETVANRFRNLGFKAVTVFGVGASRRAVDKWAGSSLEVELPSQVQRVTTVPD
jgi:superfamily II DNA or RNA helicase